MAENYKTVKVSNSGTRNEVRMRVIDILSKEAAGKGKGEMASRYTYYVETLSDDRKIYLRRPANLHNGFDFLVCVEGMNFEKTEGKRKRNYPKHEDIIEDLKGKAAESPQRYAELFRFLEKVYQCEDVEGKDTKHLTFSTGYSVELLCKTIKWLFIEQDIRYWNYSGRDMLWSGVPKAKKSDPILPFVKWAGGKRQLMEKLTKRLPKSYGTYYEPFVGGGALLLGLKPQRAVINDINGQLMNAYRWIKQDTNAVIEAVEALDKSLCDRDFYLTVRAGYNEKIVKGELDAECAGMMIWLNKHCFNGLYRTNRQGLFNVPYNNRIKGNSVDVANLIETGEYLRSADVEILCGDFEEACRGAAVGDFVFFDSPYIPLDGTPSFTDYARDGFKMEEHIRLAELFRKLDGQGVKLMMTNHNVGLVHELYKGYFIEEFNVRRAINRDAKNRTGQEVIIRNYCDE